MLRPGGQVPATRMLTPQEESVQNESLNGSVCVLSTLTGTEASSGLDMCEWVCGRV